MSETKMISYRFGIGEEPTDEMLSKLMKEVAAEAKESNQRATELYWEQIWWWRKRCISIRCLESIAST